MSCNFLDLDNTGTFLTKEGKEKLVHTDVYDTLGTIVRLTNFFEIFGVLLSVTP